MVLGLGSAAAPAAPDAVTSPILLPQICWATCAASSAFSAPAKF